MGEINLKKVHNNIQKKKRKRNRKPYCYTADISEKKTNVQTIGDQDDEKPQNVANC